MSDECLQTEFIAKCQWIQRYARTKLGMTDATMEIAANVINSEKGTRFSKEVSEKLFDGFMHFIVANETNPQVLNSLMNAGVTEGRSLGELDANGVTPAQTGLFIQKI